MEYSKIDTIMMKFASENGILLLQGRAAPHRRYFHTSNSDETFQIVIEPEADDLIRIDLHSIEGCRDNLHVTIVDSFDRLIKNIRYLMIIANVPVKFE